MNALILVISALSFVAGGPAAPAPQDQDAAMPGPGPEHLRMKDWAGEFTFVNKMWMAPGQDPMVTNGTASIKLEMNGLWLIDDTKGEMMGAEFRGHGITGFDVSKQKYVFTWVDNMTPSMMTGDGAWDDKAKTLTMVANSVDQQMKPTKVKMVTTHTDADHSKFEYFVSGPDGKEFLMMEILYTRKK